MFDDEGSGVAIRQYKYAAANDWLDYTKPLVCTTNRTVYLRAVDNLGNEATTTYKITNIEQTRGGFEDDDQLAYADGDSTNGCCSPLDNVSLAFGDYGCGQYSTLQTTAAFDGLTGDGLFDDRDKRMLA